MPEHTFTHAQSHARRRAMANLVKLGIAVPQVAGTYHVNARSVRGACSEFNVDLPKLPRTVRRPVRMIEGVTHYTCRDCGVWKPMHDFYRLANPRSACGVQSVCKTCDHARRVERRQRRRREAARV